MIGISLCLSEESRSNFQAFIVHTGFLLFCPGHKTSEIDAR
jgi:hypothetical protein